MSTVSHLPPAQRAANSENRQACERLLCPFTVAVERIARFLNCEFPDHPVYDGLELQWFDDGTHGTGMLAFLSRRADGRVDYYLQPGLNLDNANYQIGGGVASWQVTDFEVARLEVGADGVRAEVRFMDRDGHRVEVEVADGSPRSGAGAEVLAPVGAAIREPTSLLLVLMRNFDLIHRTRAAPRIRIDGEDVNVGQLPGAWLHRRHLIKAAAPLNVATVCQTVTDAPVPIVDGTGPQTVAVAEGGAGGRGIQAVTTGNSGLDAALIFDPPFPSLDRLPDTASATGVWRVRVGDGVVTGGTWRAHRDGNQADIALDVTRRWRPHGRLPLLMAVVTRLLPTFRRWPTTYMWTSSVTLAPVPRQTSSWGRTDADRGEDYRRATGGSRSNDPTRRLRRLAAGIAGAMAVMYALVFAGVLTIGPATSGDLGVLGIAGGVLAGIALLLWFWRSRLLWAATGVLQVLMGVIYFGVAAERSPAFEVWGLTLRGLSLVLVAVLVGLLFQRKASPAA